MQIGTVKIESKLALAPMAGVTDAAFRQICSEKGAGYTVTELVSAKALCYHDTKTAQLLRPFPGEKPFAAQIFGSDVNCMAEAAQMAIEISGADILDINMGCPVGKVVKSGDGSALMKDPEKAYAVIKSTVDAVGDRVPVTVKIRTGFDKEHRNAPQIARLAEEEGASAVTVHGRTREQMYAPPCDLETIAAVKRAVSIPVIGNGDIDSPRAALNMFEKTGCDGIMIGRGALGNPYLFFEILSFLENGVEAVGQTPEERMEDMEEHMRLLIAEKGEHAASVECRKHLAWYLRGVAHSGFYKNLISQLSSTAEAEKLVREMQRDLR